MGDARAVADEIEGKKGNQAGDEDELNHETFAFMGGERAGLAGECFDG